jgi:hypothetical protein
MKSYNTGPISNFAPILSNHCQSLTKETSIILKTFKNIQEICFQCSYFAGAMTFSVMTLIVTTQHNDTQRNYTQHNDTQHNDTQHNDTQYNDTQHNYTQHIDTQHNNTQHNNTQHNNTQHFFIVMMSFVMLSVVTIEIGLEQAPFAFFNLFFSAFEHFKSLLIMGPNYTKNSSLKCDFHIIYYD